MQDTFNIEQKLSIRVTVGLTTYSGHCVDWEVVGTSLSGDVHEAMANIAPGFAPQPVIAEHLRLHADEFMTQLEDTVRWSHGPQEETCELVARFAAGDSVCQLRGGSEVGWVMCCIQEGSPTQVFIWVRPRLRHDGIPTGIEAMAEALTHSSAPITGDGGGITICCNEPWTLRRMDCNTEHVW